MSALFDLNKITKQAFHQRRNRERKKNEERGQLIPLIKQVRFDHPNMGAREIHRLIRPASMGRDLFERFCFENGFKLLRKRSFIRTTNSLGVTRFENLLIGRELTGVNQVWVSDITYYRIGEQFYYLTFIIDLFSRKIVGYSVSKNLLTENTTIPALLMAISLRKPPAGVILHSDGGGQYYCKEFLRISKGFLHSMAENVYENPHAERLNGVIKNDYLEGYAPWNFESLKAMLAKAVVMYNDIKPHSALNKLSPSQFEVLLTKSGLINKRKKEAKKEKSTTTINYNCNLLKKVNAIQA